MENKTVLVIEDNDLNLKLCRSLLQLTGFCVLEAPDAEQGIEVAKQNEPDLILMDIQLPGMDGLAATKKLKEDDRMKEIPVVALTSYAMKGDKNKAMEAGCIGYITKPVDTRNFTKDVKKYLQEYLNSNTLSSEVQSNGKPLILVVDDDAFNVKLLKGKLPLETYDVITADNGLGALTQVHKAFPDLILLDVMMPGMDGFETTRRLKSDPKTQEIPIILVTALDGSNYKAIGFEAGADDFLNKPVNTIELRKRVESFLKLKRSKKNDSDDSGSLSETNDNSTAGLKIIDEFWVPHVVFAFDDEESKNQMKLFLDSENFDISNIETFDDLDSKITQGKADLILAEFCDSEAVKLCQKVKENGSTCSIQWLFLIEPQELETLNHEKVGAIDDFLVKPVNIHELRARINHLARKKKFLDKESSKSKNDFISAITDISTGIYNRTYFYYILTNEIKRSQRYGQSLALVMMKNSFDPLEDDKQRDGYLKTIAEMFKSNLREIDFVARYADDTLALILPYTDHQGAQKALGRIQRVIELDGPLTSDNGTSVSHNFVFGIASLPEDAETMVEIMEKVKNDIA